MATTAQDVEKAASDSDHSAPIAATPQRTTQDYWLRDINVTHADWLLLACCLTTGLLDSSTFRNWGSFVSMQTGRSLALVCHAYSNPNDDPGNTVILCLSTAGFPSGQPWAWAATLISLISFFLGAFLSTRVATALGARRRLVLTCNFLMQACLIAVAAALATAHVLVSDGPTNNDNSSVLHNSRILIAIGPLAFQSGATIATSRLLGFGNEIPVTVYTSTYAALAADPHLFAPPGKNKPRDRRVLAVVAVFCGSLIAAWIERRSVGPIGTFWIASGIKFVLAFLVAAFYPQATPTPAGKASA